MVIIYGDDVGFGDVGVYGSTLIPTPNTDRLAREGLRFTDGHCAAATCSPSRYSLLTGIHGFRDGVSILNSHRVVNHDPRDPVCVGKTPKAGNKPGSTHYPDGKTNREAMTYYQAPMATITV